MPIARRRPRKTRPRQAPAGLDLAAVIARALKRTTYPAVRAWLMKLRPDGQLDNVTRADREVRLEHA